MRASLGNLAAAASGALFALGLCISGMTLPSKVAGFLDVAGDWDASLAFVMMGAVSVYAVASRLVERRGAPLWDTKLHFATLKTIDRKLLLGAAVFGVGWGLGGFCPGPGLVSAASGSIAGVVFVVGMTLGMLLEHALARAPEPSSDEAADAG